MSSSPYATSNRLDWSTATSWFSANFARALLARQLGWTLRYRLVKLVASFLFCVSLSSFLAVSLQAGEDEWWSFNAPVRPAVPVNGNDHPIDSFVVKQLDLAGLALSAEADRHTLVRRLFLVMLGVPPSPGEVAAFVNDQSTTERAWEPLIDRVLADSRYGERWAQHWLDVIRWAETVGFETNAPRPNAWRYRDWVIESLNADKPYDRFVFEQIAGDTVAADAALGFLVAGPANLDGQIGRDEEAMRQARQDELDEVIRTVSQAFLGLTVACARCHDHKFDPISAKDYYAMQAIFAGLRYGDRRLRGPENDAWTAKIPAIQAKLSKLERDLEAYRQKHGLRPPFKSVQEETFDPISAKSVRMRIAATRDLSSASLYEFEIWSESPVTTNVALASNGAIAAASSFALENQTRHSDCLNDGSVDKRQAFPWRAAKGGPAWVKIDLAEPVAINRIVWHEGYSMPADYVIEVLPPDSDKWMEVAHTRDRLPRSEDTRPVGQMKLDGLNEKEMKHLVSQFAAIRSARAELAKVSAGPQVYAASFSEQPAPTSLLHRGDPMQRKEVVAPAVPAVLGNVELKAEAPENQRRLALARHLTDPNHPLTARVLVNRVWQHHFGTGLVGTPSDFGKMGGKPSHPELLDWLAVEFVQNGWSLKELHRSILTSKTFRQSSRPKTEALKIDSGARLLWRFPPRRVEAEVIRDSILVASEKLNAKAGGVGFDFFAQQGGLSDYTSHETFKEDGWRRMVYARKIRMQAVDIFGAFDCPDAGQMKPIRTRSITPVQSLSLMNSPFATRQAGFFAERVRADAGESLPAQIGHAIQIAFSRPATKVEVDALTALGRVHGLEQVCRVLLNTSEFIFLP
jgi:hypothetical protein